MGMKIVLALQYLGTNVIGNLLLIERYGVVGLAISTAITINLHYYLSAWALQNYNIGIQGWRFAWILLRHYIIGFIVFGVYVLASVNEVLSFWLDPSDLWGAIGIGGLKTAFILTLYLVVFIAPRGLRVMGLRRS
jgi:peptidoglycan biosynthesis protein MviN/MurJ (putative lipid II flippase)